MSGSLGLPEKSQRMKKSACECHSAVLRSISSFPLFLTVPYSREEERTAAKAKREAAKVIFSGMLMLCFGFFFKTL